MSQAEVRARGRASESPQRAAAVKVTFDEAKIKADRDHRNEKAEEMKLTRSATPDRKGQAPPGQSEKERKPEKEKENPKEESGKKAKNKKYWEKVKERRKEKRPTRSPTPHPKTGRIVSLKKKK